MSYLLYTRYGSFLFLYSSHVNISIAYVVLALVSVIDNLLVISTIRVVIGSLDTIGVHALLMIFMVVLWISYNAYINLAIVSLVVNEFVLVRLNISGIILSDYVLSVMDLSMSSIGWTMYTSLSILLMSYESLMLAINGSVSTMVSLLFLSLALLASSVLSDLSFLFILSLLLMIILPLLVVAIVLITVGDMDSMLYSIIFWIFGHPEVYVLLLIALIVIFDDISSILYMSSIIILLLGSIVFLHHIYLTGVTELVTIHAITTVSIALPSAIKILYLT